MKHLDRYRGCLLGGAAGDALGYPVEFLSFADIREQYGPAGMTDHILQNGVAQISDDTQMTLFTANGLLYTETRRRIGAPGGGSVTGAVAACYRDWLKTQLEPFGLGAHDHTAWLMNSPALYDRRAPGGTCLKAIAQGARESGVPEVYHCPDKKAARSVLPQLVRPDSTILVKASRGMKLEELTACLLELTSEDK